MAYWNKEDQCEPWSNGSHLDSWLGDNCDLCRRERQCPILKAIWKDGGRLPPDLAERLDPPENTWSRWQCGEFEPVISIGRS